MMNPKTRSPNSLPFFSVNSADFPNRNRLDEWNHLFKHIFELTPPSPSSSFVSETSGYILGNSIYSRGSGSGFVNHRRKEIVAQGKIDSIVLSFSTVPRCQLTETQKIVPPGDLLFLDHTRSYKFQYLKPNTNTRYLTLSRELLADDFPKIDSLHGLHLTAERGQTRLLTQTLLNLEKSLPFADNADGESISIMLGQLVIACLSPDASRTPNQRLALQEAKRLMIKSFIETNLHSPELGPGFICQHCGISQSRLYALFPDEGGIANYIWSRRLERAAKDLQDTGFAHLSVGEIA
jgi:hypothetical protein